MPYIKESRRWEIREGDTPDNVGELNFAITDLVNDWLNQKKLSYKRLNAAIGVLECAKLELYRRVVAEYEDVKCDENGDVYEEVLGAEEPEDKDDAAPAGNPYSWPGF